MLKRLRSFFSGPKIDKEQKEIAKRIGDQIKFHLRHETISLNTYHREELIVIEVVQVYYEDLGYEVTRSISRDRRRTVIATVVIEPISTTMYTWADINIKLHKRRETKVLHSADFINTTRPLRSFFIPFIEPLTSCLIESD